MTYFEYGCRATAIGSMPQTDPSEACAQVVHYLKDIPVWPQLPNRSFRENMNAQYSEGFPGLVVNESGVRVDNSQALGKPLEQLYSAYLANNIEKYPISPDYAAGLHEFLSLKRFAPLAVKGQITGPITWGLSVTDSNQRAIIYDDTLSDAAAKFLKLKAAWEERTLRKIARDTVVFLDEPYLSSYGSSGLVSLSKEKVTSLLEETLGGISGLKGIHCCGNTDWPIVLGTSINILSFDAYNYAQSLSLYPNEVKKFLARKGSGIAWGIVPSEAEALGKESVASLKDRLEDALASFTRNGIGFQQMIIQGLLTPSCGLARLPNSEAAGRALELLTQLSAMIRKRYL